VTASLKMPYDTQNLRHSLCHLIYLLDLKTIQNHMTVGKSWLVRNAVISNLIG